MYDFTILFGLIGTIIGTVAYGPQIAHIIKEKCAHGLSISAWVGWFLSSALLLPHAVVLGDPIFILLQGIGVTCTGGVLVLARIYQGRKCQGCAKD